MEKLPKDEVSEILNRNVITAQTGQRCLLSGEWEIIGTVTTSIILSKGQVMPSYMGKKVVWQFIRGDNLPFSNKTLR